MILIFFLVPVFVTAQKKFSGSPVDRSQAPSLAKQFKKYSLFTLSTREISEHVKATRGRSVDFDLELLTLDNLSLSLVEKDILSESYQSTVASNNGKKNNNRPDIKTYAGKLADDPGSEVHLTISERIVYGSIKGKGKEYFIEPLRYFDKNAATNTFVVYEPQDVIPGSEMLCGSVETSNREASTISNSTSLLGSATGTCKMVELAIASDVSMFSKYRTAEAVEEHNIAVMNVVVGFYSNAQIGSSYLEFRIKGQFISTEEQFDPLYPGYSGLSADSILRNFSRWGDLGNFNFDFDLAQLWTKRNISGGVVGLAWIGGLCKPLKKYHLLEDYTGNLGRLAVLTAHEIGHNLGAGHDPFDLGFIMSPTVNDATSFSTWSRDEMNSYVNDTSGSCLGGCGGIPVAQFNLPKGQCGNSFNVVSSSVGQVTNLLWEFPGGNPATASSSNASVSYSSLGFKTVTLTATNSFGSNSISKYVFLIPPLNNGCLSRMAVGTGLSGIANFSVADLSYTPGNWFVGPRYDNHTCTNNTRLLPGETYTASTYISDGGAEVGLQNVQLLIDYNGDGDFADADESVYFSQTCFSGTYSFTFTTPETVPVKDKMLRMRLIAMSCDMPATNGCSVSSDAQVKDFGVYFHDEPTKYFVDNDKDGYGSKTAIFLTSPTAPEGYSSNSDDCNDNDPQRHPATIWVFDADLDNYYSESVTQCSPPSPVFVIKTTQLPGDCRDFDPSANPATRWYKDSDNDRAHDGPIITQCERPAGYRIFFSGTPPLLGEDCNDNDPAINPNTIWYKDLDNDGYSNGDTLKQCLQPEGYKLAMNLTAISGDCDDNDAALNPNTIWYKDEDNDGYSDGISLNQCLQPEGYKLAENLMEISGDCNDSDATLQPNTIWYKDEDNDGYSDGVSLKQCLQPEGYKLAKNLMELSGDCNDSDATLNPNTIWYKDLDNDGHSDGVTLKQCQQPEGYKLAKDLIEISGDCNDDDASVHSLQTYYRDVDGDGFGDQTKTTSVCSSIAPAGYVNDKTDCNDNDPAISPAAVEVCGNKVDDNCNGVIDEAPCYPCQNASGFTTTNITLTSAQLNWTAVANPTQWHIQYKTTNKGSKWVDVFVTGDKRSHTAGSLSANQDYLWQVRAKCGKSWTDYAPASAFRTTSELITMRAPSKTIAANTFEVYTAPNPSSHNFTVTVRSGNTKEQISLIVTDAVGRVVDRHQNVSNGRAVQFGKTFRAGIYFVEVRQGSKRSIVKLVKL